MSTEDVKQITICTRNGSKYGVLTRMPYKEIDAELFERTDAEWVYIHGINQLDESVTIKILRSTVDAVFIEKYHPQQTKAQVQPVRLG